MQIVDEFQYLNTEMYEKSGFRLHKHGGIQKRALLVSGSWVGWLMSDLKAMAGRFQLDYLENMSEDEIVEMAFKTRIKPQSCWRIKGGLSVQLRLVRFEP